MKQIVVALMLKIYIVDIELTGKICVQTCDDPLYDTYLGATPCSLHYHFMFTLWILWSLRASNTKEGIDLRATFPVSWKKKYRLDTVNSNMVNSKFHFLDPTLLSSYGYNALLIRIPPISKGNLADEWVRINRSRSVHG